MLKFLCSSQNSAKTCEIIRMMGDFHDIFQTEEESQDFSITMAAITQVPLVYFGGGLKNTGPGWSSWKHTNTPALLCSESRNGYPYDR